jgi:hypothetical protein
MLAIGCSGEERDEEPTSAEEPLTDLDCTDEEGRPEDLKPGLEEDLYHPDAMAIYLERFDFLRKELGTTRVTTCEQAWRFTQLYREHREEINQELKADDLSEMEVPEMGDAGKDVGQGEEDAVPAPEQDETAPPDIEELEQQEATNEVEDAAAEIEKIANGTDSNYSFAVSFVLPGKDCTATVIGPRAIITAAHCVPAAGWYLVDLKYQLYRGAATTSIFGGARHMYLYRHQYYTGPGNEEWDIGIGVYWDQYANNLPYWMWTRLYMGDISEDDLQYHVGYGFTGPNTSYGHQHLGYSRVTDVETAKYESEPWNSSTPRIFCPGDSGGPTGLWHTNAAEESEFVLYGINSSAWCGAVHNTTDFENGFTRVRAKINYIEAALGYFGISCTALTLDHGAVPVRECW